MSNTTATATALPFNGTVREEIFEAIKDAPDGLTDEELQMNLGFIGNTERPRRGELVAAGRIRQSGTRQTESGRQATVWVANKVRVAPMLKKTGSPKSVTITQKRGPATIRKFKSFVTATGPRSQVIMFPQTLSVQSGDTLTIE